MSQNITDESQTTAEQPTSADLLGKMTEAIGALNEAQEHLVDVAKDVAKHTTDPNAHGAATLANIAKALPTPVLEDGMFTFKDAAGKPLMEPVNIKGEPGKQGEKGEDGEKGDMPDHQWNGTSLQIQKPDGSWGEEQNLQGPKGTDGQDGAPGQAPEHQWNGTTLKFKNPDGSWGEEHNLKGEPGAKGEDGEKGDMPDHRWNGTSLQIQKPDGSWGEEQNLQGPKGEDGDAAVATSEQPGIMQPDGVTTTVDEEGLLSALGGNLQLNDEELITVSGTWTAKMTGWHKITIWHGGGGGWWSTSLNRGCGGMGVAPRTYLMRLTKGQEVPVGIAAGGLGTAKDGAYPPEATGGVTTFGDLPTEQDKGTSIIRAPYLHAGLTASTATYISGAGVGGANAASATAGQPSFFGAGGAVCYTNDAAPSVSNGYQGAVLARWHDPTKAGGPLPESALFAARRLAAHMADGPVTVNLYDPETGLGTVWNAADAEAKLAEGLVSEEAWREICAEQAAADYEAWLADPATEAERFALLRAAREARLAEYDAAVAQLRREERAGEDVADALAAWDAYANALCALPAQPGAPWDGGGELTPWPEMPTVAKVPSEEPEQTVEPEA